MDLELDNIFKNPYLNLHSKQKQMVEDSVKRMRYLVRGEAGSGKTIITVYIMKIWFIFNLIQKVLIITKNEVSQKYKDELLKHISILKDEDIYIMKDNINRDLFGNKAKIYICDINQIRLIYEKYAGKLEAKLKGVKRKISNVFPIDKNWAVIYDEMQYVKNIKSDIHKIIYKNTKDALAKIGTTATPVEKIEDFYAIYRILDERIIGIPYHFFMQQIAYLRDGTYRVLYYKEDGVKNIREKIDPFMGILKKSDMKEMVSRNIINVEIDFTNSFRQEYDMVLQYLQKSIFKEGQWKKRGIATLIQPIYNKIKEVSENNPRFVKFNSLINRFITNEKIIVWERAPEIMDKLSEYYNNKGIKNLIIYGDVDKYKRKDIIHTFNTDPEYKILFISFLTTAESWEIPSRKDCRRMVFYSLPDRLIKYDQSIDRLHRLSSMEGVYIYILLLKDSIDEWAVSLLEYKDKLINGMVTQEEFNKIEEESYLKFLGFNKKNIV